MGIQLKSLSMSHECLSHHCWSQLGGGGAAGDGCCGGCCSSGVLVVAMRQPTAHNPKRTKMHEETLAASWTARPGKRKEDKEECRGGDKWTALVRRRVGDML